MTPLYVTVILCEPGLLCQGLLSSFFNYLSDDADLLAGNPNANPERSAVFGPQTFPQNVRKNRAGFLDSLLVDLVERAGYVLSVRGSHR